MNKLQTSGCTGPDVHILVGQGKLGPSAVSFLHARVFPEELQRLEVRRWKGLSFSNVRQSDEE